MLNPWNSRPRTVSLTGRSDTVNSSTIPPYNGYTPFYPTTSYLGVSVTQAVTRFQSVNGYRYSNNGIANASVTQIPFTEKILASAGRFSAGTVDVSISSSDAEGFPVRMLSRMEAWNMKVSWLTIPILPSQEALENSE